AVAKKVVTKIATKVAAKVAAKTTIKAGGSIVAGASSGALAGLVCGPAAAVCSTVGGVVGGVGAWLAIDKAVIEVDQALTEDDFRADIVSAIDDSKEELKKEFISIYTGVASESMQGFKKSLDEIKKEPVGERIQ
ncbi:MAG: hypothetical protein ACLFQJ_10185, partial [Campylobacterales bacterium]